MPSESQAQKVTDEMTMEVPEQANSTETADEWLPGAEGMGGRGLGSDG